ncbi:MAG: YD repeat-containing protein [Candidatus Solibacter sp.]|nr:YD repeat-containing protein [Candidatus Solibacter sp.]
MHRLLPLAALAVLWIPGLYGQIIPLLDCGQPADVLLTPASPRANLRFQGTAGETVYVRLMAASLDPGFALTLPVVVDPFGNTYNPRARNPPSPGATPGDLAGAFAGENFTGLEFDLPTEGTCTLRLTSSNLIASANIHVVLTRLNRPCGPNTTLTCGRSLAGAIATSVPGQVDNYQFSVQAGDIVSFRLLRVASSGSPDTSTSFFFAIYAADPARDNRPFAVNVDPKTNHLSFARIYGRFDWTATVTGAVTVVVFEATATLGGSYYVSATKLSGGGCGGAPLTCNSTVDGGLTSPLTFGFYTIQANGGDLYQFRAARLDTSGGFTPAAEIFDSRGASVGVVAPVIPSGHAAATATITFPTSGTYSVIVSGPLDGSLGAYSLSTLRLNRPCDGVQALSCSSVVDGAISGLIRGKVYSLAASAGDSYLLRLLRPDANSLFRPRVDIYDKSGASIQFVNTTDLARAAFTAPADGVYSLVVTDSFDNAQSGSYSLSLLRLNRPCDAATLSCGAPAAGSLPRALSSSVHTHTAAAGESFSVRMLPDSGAQQPGIEVYDGQGNPAGQPLSGNFAGVDVVRPPAGAYTVVATDSSKTPAASSFTLDLLRTTNACSVPAAQGTTVNGAVSAASPFLAYRIAASSGDLLSLRSSSSTAGFASQMELYDPEGMRLESGVFSLSRKAPASGTYTVILGAAVPRTAGGYSFAWQLLNQPAGVSPLACGASAAGALSPSSQFRYYGLAANAGDTLRLLFTRISENFSPQIELFDPAGARVAANSDVTHKAVAGGSYLVVVSPSTSLTETGSYSVAFQRPNSPCSPLPLACGQTALRQVNVPGQLDTFSFNATGGDQTTIRLTSRSGTYSPFAEMYNPAGTLLSTSSNGLLRRVLPADGAYTLLVRDRNALNLGSYRVNLQDDTNACPVTDTEAPVVVLARPTGGEVLSGGTTFRIQWLSDDNVGVADHNIALSTDGGKTFADPFVNLGGNTQAYDWNLPAGIAPNRTAVLRVTATDAAGNAQSASSDLLTLIGSGFTPNSTATYSYDELNRLTDVSLSDGRTIKYTWDASGNLASITITAQ